MAIKLNSSGGGSVTVDAPVTASNLTVTLPSSNGTIATTDGGNTTFTSITDSGNLTFTGTGNRIIGDFSNATMANRVAFQTSTTNGNTIVAAIPNGTSTTSGLWVWNNSDITNASRFRFTADASLVSIVSDFNGTGTYLPLTFYTGGSERMRIDTSGNVGIGITPSAWDNSGFLQLGDSKVITFSGTAGRINTNAYYNAGWKYVGTGTATQYSMQSGQHVWLTATSGTAGGVVPFVQSMTLDASGNLLVGTTSSATPSTTGYISTANTFGFKNRIINGAMMIDQRNAGASVAITAAGNYVADRFYGFATQSSKLTMQQSTTAPAGFTNSLLATSLSAYTVGSTEQFTITQQIEGLNVADLGFGTVNASTVTISFWVRCSLTGTFGGALKNSDSSRSYPFSYTISSANTWEQKSITIPGDTTGTWLTTNGRGMSVNICLGAGSTLSGTANAWAAGNYPSVTGATSVVGTNGATFYITGVQLEKGTAATSFDYRPYGTELALCQRYCFGWYANTATAGIVVGAATTPGLYSDANTLGMIGYSVPAMSMRDNTALSVTTVGTQGTDWGVYTSGGVIQTGFTITAGKAGGITATKTSHGLTNAFLGVAGNNTTGKILITSEL